MCLLTYFYIIHSCQQIHLGTVHLLQLLVYVSLPDMQRRQSLNDVISKFIRSLRSRLAAFLLGIIVIQCVSHQTTSRIRRLLEWLSAAGVSRVSCNKKIPDVGIAQHRTIDPNVLISAEAYAGLELRIGTQAIAPVCPIPEVVVSISG
jgi:hypothetical protein